VSRRKRKAAQVAALAARKNEDRRTFEIPVSARLAHYLVTAPRRLPEDEETRNELLNFVHLLRSNLQHIGVFAEAPGSLYGSQR
jgi:hypothetical protein